MKNTRLYLKVPYSEKDDAKALEARWDPERKEWYIDNSKIYHLFRKWYYNQETNGILHDYIYIATTNRTCFKCNHQTQVVALASPDSTYIDEDGDIIEENSMDFFCYINYLPENLSKFLKEKYNFYYGYSNFTKSYYYGNHCTHCGVLQGENYLYSEVDSVFNINSVQKAKNIILFKLDLAEAMQIGFSDISSSPINIGYLQSGNHLLLEYSEIRTLIV